MSLTNIKLKSNEGFTIVELLIVVVVIAILAAITIVSYNGITNKANASSAKSVAATAQKKIELYNSENSRYPIAASELTSDTTKSFYLAAASFGSSDPTSASPTSGTDTKGTKYVKIQACKSDTAALSASNVTGSRITYYDYEKTSPLTTIDLGTNCGTNLSNLN